MNLKLDLLTAEMIDFAQNELGVSEDDLRNIENNEELRQELLEKLLWIEVDEIEDSPEEKYSERGEIASGLLTLLCYPDPGDEESDEEE